MSMLISALILKAVVIATGASHRDQDVDWGIVEAAITSVLLDDAPCSHTLVDLGVCLSEDTPPRDAFACTGDPLGFIEALEATSETPRSVRIDAAQTILAQLQAVAGDPNTASSVEIRLQRAVERDQVIRRWRPEPWSSVANGVKWSFACAHAAYGAALVNDALNEISISRLEGDESLAEDIWLLSQHVDHDPDFQERMAAFFRGSEAAHMRGHAAFLTDRHRQWQGLPQIYGTQFRCIDGVLQPYNLIDPETVDERRAENGLGPITEAVGGAAFTSCG